MSEREQVLREWIEWQLWLELTVATCCEEAGVSVASFYRWKKLLAEPQGPRQSIASDQGSSMRIELPNGVVIHVADDLDGQRLGDVSIAADQVYSVLCGATICRRQSLPRTAFANVSDCSKSRASLSSRSVNVCRKCFGNRLV